MSTNVDTNSSHATAQAISDDVLSYAVSHARALLGAPTQMVERLPDSLVSAMIRVDNVRRRESRRSYDLATAMHASATLKALAVVGALMVGEIEVKRSVSTASPCPTCKAKGGERCRTRGGQITKPHETRRSA